MKWILKDIDVLLQSKDYVDTAFVPLIPVAFRDRMKHSVSMGEYTTTLLYEMERQLHGRTIVVPSFTYLMDEPMEQRLTRLEQWTRKLTDAQFNHVFFITSDGDWKQEEDKLDAVLIWLPVIPLEHMDDQYKRDIVSEQTKQLLQIVTKKWQFES